VQGYAAARRQGILFVCSLVRYFIMSWSSNSPDLFSSPSPGNGEREHHTHSEWYLLPTPGGDFSQSYEAHPEPDIRSRDSPSPPAAIPLRDYLASNPNFLRENPSNSLLLDSYSSGRPLSYPWEVFVANPLPGPFASIGMPSTDVVVEPNQDPTLSEGPARSDPEDGPVTHYIDPFFRDEL